MNDAKESELCFTGDKESSEYIKYIKETRIIQNLCHTSHL